MFTSPPVNNMLELISNPKFDVKTDSIIIVPPDTVPLPDNSHAVALTSLPVPIVIIPSDIEK